jgi:serine protease AprX
MIGSMLILLFSSLSFAKGDAKISAELEAELRESGVANVMVYLISRADLTNVPPGKNRSEKIRTIYHRLVREAESSQKPLVELLKKRKAEFRAYHIVNGVLLIRANQKILEEVAALPIVKSIRLDLPQALRLPPATGKERVLPEDDKNIPASLKAMGVDKVWAELKNKGSGIVIAGQDGGFDWGHPALKRQYRGFHGLGANHNYSWHDAIHRTQFEADNAGCSPDSPVPCDDTGHGTHTMGTMVGDDGGGNRVGVAPEATWIGCRNMFRGKGTAATYLECMEFFLAPYPLGGNARTDGRPDLAPHIMNNSWSCPPSEGCKGGEFLEAIRVLSSAGILIVAAAGNDGPGCATMNDPPGYYWGELISVGAYDHRNNQAADFSSRGPSSWNGGVGPNISAPGSMIRSTVPGGDYDYKSGTSMASPHVAGLLALLWAGKPELVGQVRETIQLLHSSAVPQRSRQSCGGFPGDKQPNAVFGYGFANAFRALTGVTN